MLIICIQITYSLIIQLIFSIFDIFLWVNSKTMPLLNTKPKTTHNNQITVKINVVHLNFPRYYTSRQPEKPFRRIEKPENRRSGFPVPIKPISHPGNNRSIYILVVWESVERLSLFFRTFPNEKFGLSTLSTRRLYALCRRIFSISYLIGKLSSKWLSYW